MRLLFAEDEVSLSKAVVTILRKNNYTVDAAYDGVEALEYLETNEYDGVVLDVMMPRMDGISVLQKLRKAGSNVPVLMLTARAEIDDKVLGLDSGANDYLTKPFASKELLARIRAMTRSSSAAVQVDSRLRFGNITLDCATFELSSPYNSFILANKEFQMTELMMRNPDRYSRRSSSWIKSGVMMRTPRAMWCGRISPICARSSQRSRQMWRSGQDATPGTLWSGFKNKELNSS